MTLEEKLINYAIAVKQVEEGVKFLNDVGIPCEFNVDNVEIPCQLEIEYPAAFSRCPKCLNYFAHRNDEKRVCTNCSYEFET